MYPFDPIAKGGSPISQQRTLKRAEVVDRQQKGFSEMEVTGASRKLCLYGDAFEAQENPKVRWLIVG
jgi:hypothetical protein